jgi:tRNA A37 methylthiotransferase MiaB
MRIYILGLNPCPMRKQNILFYKEYLSDNGYLIVENLKDCECVLIYTCGFRADMVDYNLAQIDNIKASYPDKKMVIAGCLPDIAPKELKKHYQGEIITWKNQAAGMNKIFPGKFSDFDSCNDMYGELPLCDNAAEYRKKHPGVNVTFHDQFIKLLVSEGCPNKCTYCTEKLAFPSFVSYPLKKIIQKAIDLRGNCVHGKFMLLADNLGEYGKDIGLKFPDLVYRIKKYIPDATFAFCNFHPLNMIEYKKEIASFIRDGWINHISLPIQSASDRILVKMRRGYDVNDLEYVFDQFKLLNFDRFETHLIVGFPSETEKDFQQTIDFVLEHKPKYVLLNKYYEASTAQAKFIRPKISDKIIKNRIARAVKIFTYVNIIVNFEDSKLMEDRTNRLNYRKEKL